MSLHEYIDIPLEGFLFTVLPPPTSLLLPTFCTLSSRHPLPLLATRLFKEWLEASTGVRMNAREDRVPGGKEGNRGAAGRFVLPSAPMSVRSWNAGC